MNAKDVLNIQLETCAEVCRVWGLPRSDYRSLARWFSKRPKALKITSVEMLRNEAKEGADFFIVLKGGARSTKFINSGCCAKFHVENLIDGTHQRLSNKELMDKKITNIGYAIKRGAFYKDLT